MSKVNGGNPITDNSNLSTKVEEPKHKDLNVSTEESGSSKVKEPKAQQVDPESQTLETRKVKKQETVYQRIANVFQNLTMRTKITPMIAESGQIRKNALESLLNALKNQKINPQDAQTILNEFRDELKTQAPKNIMFHLFTMENLSAKERFKIAEIFEDTLMKDEKVIDFQEWTSFQLMKVENTYNEKIDHELLIAAFNSLKTGILTTEGEFASVLEEQMTLLLKGEQVDLDAFWSDMMEGFATTKAALDVTIGDIETFKTLVSGQISEHFVEAFKKARSAVNPAESPNDEVNKILKSDEFENLLTAFVADYIKTANPRDIMMLLMNQKTEALEALLLERFKDKSIEVLQKSNEKNFKPKTDFEKTFVKLCSSYEKILSNEEIATGTIKGLMTKIKEAFKQGKVMGIAISVIAAVIALSLLATAVITGPVALAIFGGTVIAFFLYGFIKGIIGRSIEKDLERIKKAESGVLSVVKLLIPDIEKQAADFIEKAPQKIAESAKVLQKEEKRAVVTP